MNKRGKLQWDYLGWLILGVIAFMLILTAYFIITGKLQGSLEYVKNLFLFRR